MNLWEVQMAKPHLERLLQVVDHLGMQKKRGVTLEAKHFFSGAALYANGNICAFLNPAGFAVKAPASMQSLIWEGKGTELRFFATGPIKREIIAVARAATRDHEVLRMLIDAGVDFVTGLSGPETGGEEG